MRPSLKHAVTEGTTTVNFLDSLGAAASAVPQPRLTGENCTVVFTDVVGFGAHERTDRDRKIIRAANLDMMRTSLESLWEKCITEDLGDGFLIVVPPAIPTSAVMERLHQELPRELRKHNHSHGKSARIRLRVAVNVGPVMSDGFGLTGEAIIRTARLLDAPILREVMAVTSASLGMIVSTFVYETVVGQAQRWADRYNEVHVHVKETNIAAWMRLIPAPAPGLRHCFLYRLMGRVARVREGTGR